MYLDSKFKFGKYNGLTLQEVYQGSLNPDRKLISLYLEKILNNCNSAIPLDPCFEFIKKFIVSETTIQAVGGLDLIDEGKTFEGSPVLTLGAVDLGNIQDEIKKFINYHFSSNWLGILENIAIFNSHQEQRVVLGADPLYLEWCIKEVEDFKINEAAIDALQQLSISRLVGIEVIYIKRNIYEFAPKVKAETFKLSKEVLQLNSSKQKAKI